MSYANLQRRRNPHRFTSALLMLTCAALFTLNGCDDASLESAATSSAAAPASSDVATPSAVSATQSITDDMGRTVTLPASPTRVTAGVPFAVEMLYLLQKPPVARPIMEASHVRPEQALDLPAVSIDHGVGPNLEQLALTNAQVVVLSPTFAQFAPAIEENLGIPTVIYDIRSLDDVPRVLRAMGQWTNATAAAEAAASELTSQFEQHRHPPASGPRVFAIFGAGDAFFAFLPDSYLGSMIELLGGQMITRGNAALRPGSSLSPFSLEAAVAADPDVILVVRHGPAGEAARQMREQPAWQNLRAVREGRVHQIDEWLYLNNPGPSAPQALTQLEALLYPPAD